LSHIPHAIEYKDNPPTCRDPSSNRNLDAGAGKTLIVPPHQTREREGQDVVCSFATHQNLAIYNLEDQFLPNEPGSSSNLNILSPGETRESIDARLNELVGAPDTVGLPSFLSLGCSELSCHIFGAL
jgi:hypothetical protein